MSAVRSVSQVIEAVAEQLVASELTRSRYVVELFGRDPRSLAHKSFAVGSPRARLSSPAGRGDFVPDQGLAVSTIQIRTAYMLRGDRQVGDFGDALDHEQRVLQTALSLDLGVLALQPVELTREVVPTGDWCLSRLELAVQHRFALLPGVS